MAPLKELFIKVLRTRKSPYFLVIQGLPSIVKGAVCSDLCCYACYGRQGPESPYGWLFFNLLQARIWSDNV